MRATEFVVEGTGDSPADPAASREFVSNKYYVKFTPTELLIYRGGELVYKKAGDYSNLTRAQAASARGITSLLWNQEQKGLVPNLEFQDAEKELLAQYRDAEQKMWAAAPGSTERRKYERLTTKAKAELKILRKNNREWKPKPVATNTIAESLSRVAYHYTGLAAANKILQSGEFQLSSAPGSIEQQYAPKGKPYFLSTTRTKTGGYHQGSKWRGAMFVLNGDWFNQRYKSGPLDYWGNRGSGMRASEAEDRVYSAEPTIPTGGVSAVHVFVAGDQPDDENLKANRATARQVLIAAKTQGIPAYYYDNHDAWLQQDTRQAAAVSQLTGKKPDSYYRGYRRRTYMDNWLELIGANAQNQLSREGDKLRYNLNYDYDRRAAAQSLETDMANARKPDSGPERETAVKIIRYMQKHRLNTMAEFVDHIAAKWKAITSANK